MSLRASAVFSPGAFPTHTYVERKAAGLEGALADSLETVGQVISISGPSKSGKTVLVEKVVGPDSLITISGATIQHPDDVWRLVLDWMETPATVETAKSTSHTISAEAGASGELKVPFIGGLEVDGKAGVERSSTRETTEARQQGGMGQVVKEIGGSNFVVLLDDFHYMPRVVQTEVAKQIKEAVRQGVKICTAAVSHRGDDVVRANPELRGRTRSIDLSYWSREELLDIAKAGFATLNAELAGEIPDRFAGEAAGSPQLMQLICLQACFVLDHREKSSALKKFELDASALRRIFEQAGASTNFQSLVDVLDGGPKTRGNERKVYSFHDGSQGDVYRCILRAIASDPPTLAFDYDELTKRVQGICNGDPPVGGSVLGSCSHMSKLAIEKFPQERAIDWDEQKLILDLPDPYLLFYLRWSSRLA